MNQHPITPSLAQHVLLVHHRNGGTLEAIDASWRLLDPTLKIDSLDLAEILVAIEREAGLSPFEASPPPRTWGDVDAWFQNLPRPQPAAPDNGAADPAVQR